MHTKKNNFIVIILSFHRSMYQSKKYRQNYLYRRDEYVL